MVVGTVLAMLALILLAYYEVCHRIGRLAARIVLVSSEGDNTAQNLLITHLTQTALCAIISVFQLASRELCATAFYLLLIKGALMRRPAAWLPHGLAFAASVAATAWLALGHWLVHRRVEAEPLTDLLAAWGEGLIIGDRLDLWIAAAVMLYVLGWFCLAGWLVWRAAVAPVLKSSWSRQIITVIIVITVCCGLFVLVPSTTTTELTSPLHRQQRLVVRQMTETIGSGMSPPNISSLVAAAAVDPPVCAVQEPPPNDTNMSRQNLHLRVSPSLQLSVSHLPPVLGWQLRSNQRQCRVSFPLLRLKKRHYLGGVTNDSPSTLCSFFRRLYNWVIAVVDYVSSFI